MAGRALRLGVIGLGRAFSLMLPTFAADPRVRLVAAADPKPEARAQFERDFGTAHADPEAVCAEPAVEAVYIASPHQMHAAHVRLAAAAGKHVLVEKPMAIALDDCDAMIEAVVRAGVHLIVGHSHSFNRPVLRLHALVASGAFGPVRMIQALNCTDFLYRPRRPEELDTAQGGGVIFSQGAHQIDIVRLIGGGRVESITAATGAWDPARPTEGAYSALMQFEGGAFASASYNGYGHFDSDEFTGWIGELGARKDRSRYGAARRALRAATDPASETALKNARTYGGPTYAPPTAAQGLAHQHFGFLLASCDGADLRPMPDGVMIYADTREYLEPIAPPTIPRAEVIDELYDAVVHGRAPLHDGIWARATLEVCLAILSSAQERRPVSLRLQAAAGAPR
jgi:phthalate 4,5-cis-dihydrodiol dehydrogenase